MRRRSLAAPLLLIIIGALFLWYNIHPEASLFDLVSLYWPYALIAWGVLRLLEVLVWRNARHSGLSGGEIVLIIFICLIGSGMFEARRHGIRPFAIFGPPGIFGQQFDYPVSTQTGAAGVRRIVLDNLRGSVHIMGADTQQIAITGHKLIRAFTQTDADRANDATPVEFARQGDELLLSSHQDRAPSGQRVEDDLEITLPRGMGVEARGDNGDYDIADIQADVQLTSGRADVRLARIGGNVRLDVGRSDTISAQDISGNLEVQGGRGSDIDLANIAGPVTIRGDYLGSLEFKNLAQPLRVEGARNTELQVQAVPGSISMDLGDFAGRNLVGPLRLVTQSRDIKIEDFTESLELETQRGDVDLEPNHVPLPKIEAHSGVGEIDLVLPSNAAFQLEATAERGGATNDFGPPIETQTQGRTATLRGAIGNGPPIHITADRGSISVRREGAVPSIQIPEPPSPAPPALPRPPVPPAPPNLKDTETKL
jgi:hypothetical protein